MCRRAIRILVARLGLQEGFVRGSVSVMSLPLRENAPSRPPHQEREGPHVLGRVAAVASEITFATWQCQHLEGGKGRGGLATRRTAGAGQKSPPLPPHNNGRTRLKSATPAIPTKNEKCPKGRSQTRDMGVSDGRHGATGPPPRGAPCGTVELEVNFVFGSGGDSQWTHWFSEISRQRSKVPGICRESFGKQPYIV